MSGEKKFFNNIEDTLSQIPIPNTSNNEVREINNKDSVIDNDKLSNNNEKVEINDSISNTNTNENIETLEVNEKEDNIISDAKQSVKKEVKGFTTFFKDLFKYLKTRNTSELFSVFLRVVLIFGICFFMSLPFQFFRDMGRELMTTFGVDFNEGMSRLWDGIWNISYYLIAIFSFYIVVRDRFYALTSDQELIAKLKKEVGE